MYYYPYSPGYRGPYSPCYCFSWGTVPVTAMVVRPLQTGMPLQLQLGLLGLFMGTVRAIVSYTYGQAYSRLGLVRAIVGYNYSQAYSRLMNLAGRVANSH